MRFAIQQVGHSRSFPPDDPFLAGASPATDADVLVYLGAPAVLDATKKAVLIELANECLAEHVDEAAVAAGNVLGFCRYRNGSDAPSKLIELVRPRGGNDEAVQAARAVFEAAGLTVVVCADQPGRILDRLLRPKYNAALRFLDEGLATAEDMDTTCRLGLGYPDGPIERIVRGGLAYHCDITQALFETFGTPGYAPAPRALAAKRRRKSYPRESS
jgi:3-hydroxybutyryl-CoA dehydrogenase